MADQGRGNAHAAPLLLITFALQCCCLWHQASAVTHTVGGSNGWDFNVDYSTWAAGQTFKLGDILFFPYSEAQHNVVVVDKAGYDGCSDANAAATFSAGNTNVTLSTTGTHYYLCSVVGHCSAGMKLAVTVTAAAPAPTASPPVTAPSPSKTPSSSPITAPSTAPSSKPTPASAPSPSPSPPAPAPTPSGEAPAPAPAPTPSSPASGPTVGPPASSPGAPGSTPSSTGTPPSSPPPPNAAPSLLASAAYIAPLVALWAVLLV